MSIQGEVSPLAISQTAVFVTPKQSLNNLLASLPVEDYERIGAHLKPVPMRVKQVLYKQNAPVEAIYFPGGGACMLVKRTEDGRTAEVGVVGREGVIGGSLLFALGISPCDVIVQMAGPCDELPLDAFAKEMERRGALHRRIATYSGALVTQLMQATACNSLHSASKRLARWLLVLHDRTNGDELPFTHEFASTMLGLRRPTVTLIAAKLQAAGVIEYRRGTVRIRDRAGLEAASCECYRFPDAYGTRTDFTAATTS